MVEGVMQIAKPISCPRCKSYKWNQPPKKK